MIEKAIDDSVLTRHLESITADGMDLFLTEGGGERVAVLHATRLVNQMAVNHQIRGADAERLALGYILVLLGASTIKNAERVLLVHETPDGGVVTEATGTGSVRGYLKHGEEDAGTVAMLRYSKDQDLLHHGQIETVSDDITKDVMAYYNRSEQIPTTVRAGISRDTDGRIIGAAGFIVQRLPNGDNRRFTSVRNSLPDGNTIAEFFARGGTATGFVRDHVGHLAPRLIATRAAEFTCHCSKERFGRFLTALPDEERRDILVNGPFPLRTTCHNCNTTYSFERPELEQMFATVRS